MPVISIESVYFYRQGSEILKDINWTARRDEHWVMVGPNGAGKSTLAAVLCAHSWPSRGSVRVLGETYGRVNLREFKKRLGVFQPAQQNNLGVFHPRLTARDVICTGVDGSLAKYQEYPEDVVRDAQNLLNNYFQDGQGIEGFPGDRPFRLLSSGERRKTLLLRVLIARPELLLLDEPYESLDIPSRISLEKSLQNYVQTRRCFTLTIVHRIEEIPVFATHALLIKNGEVFARGPVDEIITSEKLSSLYETPLTIGRKAAHFFWYPNTQKDS